MNFKHSSPCSIVVKNIVSSRVHKMKYYIEQNYNISHSNRARIELSTSLWTILKGVHSGNYFVKLHVIYISTSDDSQYVVSPLHATWRSTKVFPLPVPIHMCHIPYTFMVVCVLLSLSELTEALQPNLTTRFIISVDQKKEETPASWGSKHEWRVSLPAGYCHLLNSTLSVDHITFLQTVIWMCIGTLYVFKSEFPWGSLEKCILLVI